MPLPDLADRGRFPPFAALPTIESDAGGVLDDSDSPEAVCLLAQVKDDMTVTQPTLVLTDRDGHPFALVFDGVGRDASSGSSGLDLAARGLKKGATAVVLGARQTVPSAADVAAAAANQRAAKRPFVRIPAGQADRVRAVAAPLDRVLAAAAAARQADDVGTTRRCSACGKSADDGSPLLKCTGCRHAWYCSRACQTQGWTDGHKGACKVIRGVCAILG